MTRVKIDQERLAHGLERGIGRVEDAVVEYFLIPRKYRLRVPVCGLVSIAIQDNLAHKGVESTLQLSWPEFPFDSEYKHVVPVTSEAGNQQTIDAAYSHLFEYVGLDHDYEQATGTRYFPDKKVLCFRLSERDTVAGWIAGVAQEFQKSNLKPVLDDGYQLGNGPLADSPVQEVAETLSRVWDPANFSVWEPSEGTLAAGIKVGSYIDSKAIEIN